MFNNVSSFEEKFLKYLDNMVCIGAMSFEKIAEILYNNWDSKSTVNPDRIETAWFIYRMLEFENNFVEWPRCKDKSLDLEALCKVIYPKIRLAVDDIWLRHVCQDQGCKERFIVIDGNEKLYRFICAAERNKIMGNPGEVNHYDMCIRNPVRGNQYGKSDKYCLNHINGKSSITDEQLDMRPITRSMSKLIPETITSGSGCKTEDKVDKFYSRTAGMFYLFRPCGIRLANFEMYTAESLSSVFTYLLDLFGESPQPSDLSGIVYDRACDLHPFIERLHREGNFAASKYQNLDFIVDAFHVENHTQAKCLLGHPECYYHPDLPKFSRVSNMNTEVAEQSFSRLNPFKYATRRMNYSKRLLFLKFVDHSSNKRLLRSLSMQ